MRPQLGAHLRSERPENANFEIDPTLPERKSIFNGLGRETQADPRRGLRDGSHQGRGEAFNEPLVGAKREVALKRGDVQ
jgi:hypothetical protein